VSTKRLAEVQAQMDLLSQKLAELEELPEPDGDEALRSQVIDERDKQADNYIAEYKALDKELGPLLERAKELDVIRAAARDQTRVESGDGAKYLGTTGPEYRKKVDPFAGDIRRASHGEVISRAMSLVDGERRVPISDEGKAHLERLIHRSMDDEENGQIDGAYIAKRTLYTEDPMYRSAFRKYARFGGMAHFNADESRAVAAFQEYEVLRAASENTTTAGGFGIPVNLAA